MLTVFLHRLLQSFLLPPLNSLLIILLGLYYFKLHRTRSKVILLIGCLSLYLQATPMVAYKLNRLVAPASMKLSLLANAQAIVLLGGGVNSSAAEYNVNAISNPDTLVRIRYTAYLAKKQPQLPIFVSGGAIDTKDSEASLMRNALHNEFAIKNSIYLEPDSKTTAENARYTAHLLQQYGISRVVLVSSSNHVRRAAALFKQNGIQVISAPTGFYACGYYRWPLLWFIPNSYAMTVTSSVIHELLGYIYDVQL